VDRARDVVQETFLRLCNQKREDVAEHLTEWLFKVCRNQALDVYRKESRMSTLSEEQAKQTVDANASPASAMEREDELSLVLGCLDRLPDKQQEVLRLKFQHGLS
jgi:RNA polymerase sigma-70 factor (ECF subfamily)